MLDVVSEASCASAKAAHGPQIIFWLVWRLNDAMKDKRQQKKSLMRRLAVQEAPFLF
jgi:hypothetical protein